MIVHATTDSLNIANETASVLRSEGYEVAVGDCDLLGVTPNADGDTLAIVRSEA